MRGTQERKFNFVKNILRGIISVVHRKKSHQYEKPSQRAGGY